MCEGAVGAGECRWFGTLEPCAVVPGSARSYPEARGRTQERAVVPEGARSYLKDPLRYDRAALRTTARAGGTTTRLYVRPRGTDDAQRRSGIHSPAPRAPQADGARRADQRRGTAGPMERSRTHADADARTRKQRATSTRDLRDSFAQGRARNALSAERTPPADSAARADVLRGDDDERAPPAGRRRPGTRASTHPGTMPPAPGTGVRHLLVSALPMHAPPAPGTGRRHMPDDLFILVPAPPPGTGPHPHPPRNHQPAPRDPDERRPEQPHPPHPHNTKNRKGAATPWDPSGRILRIPGAASGALTPREPSTSPGGHAGSGHRARPAPHRAGL